MRGDPHARSARIFGRALPKAGVAKDPGHVAGRGATEQARRAGRQRGHLDVFGDRTHDGGRPRILLWRTPHSPASTPAPVGTTREHNDVRLQTNHFGREVAEAIHVPACAPELDHKVPPSTYPSSTSLRMNVARHGTSRGETSSSNATRTTFCAYCAPAASGAARERKGKMGNNQDSRHGSPPADAASARASQNPMSISRYMALAVIRCSCAFTWSPVRR